MTTIFDGRSFADEKMEELKIITNGLKSRGKTPHLASILVGNDEASKLYMRLKKKAAERIGAEFDAYFLPEKVDPTVIFDLIESLNADGDVQGVMIQMPVPDNLLSQKEKIINAIDPKKDVDGLLTDSQFLHPTSRAVIDILKEAQKDIKPPLKESLVVAVVGSMGMVGKPLVRELKKEGYQVLEANGKTTDLGKITILADVVISATGVAGLIKPEMIKEGAIVIDVGSPHGDFDPSVSGKASFFTPVPGGVGPVTISCLLENLISSC